jgi:hypothetical protein
MKAAPANAEMVLPRLVHSSATEGASLGGKDSPFYVPPFLHALGGLVERHPAFWLWFGRLESRVLEPQLRSVSVRAPIYVCGLARSGSTLLHEFVASHPDVATHRMLDYPMLFTPYWWRRAIANIRSRPPRERAHRDGVMVTSQSPDALEEMVWTAFFPRCHDPSVSNLISAGDSHPMFEEFYTNHIRKLLLAEQASRYAAKANYHVARLPYLVRIFPDARFLVPVRGPADHIGSLMKQHRWFSEGQRNHARMRAFMRRTGHFEFGLDRRPIHFGDDPRVRQIQQAWASGDELRGLAMYWDMVHAYLACLLAADAKVRQAVMVVQFEEMCAEPARTLTAVLNHCELPATEAIINRQAANVRHSKPYHAFFSSAELATIQAETAKTASLWGYACSSGTGKSFAVDEPGS